MLFGDLVTWSLLSLANSTMNLSLIAELHESQPAEPLALEPPASRKSPFAAFLLSVLMPGAGHMYMDRIGQGLGLFFLIVLSVAFCVSGVSALVGNGIIMLPSIYLFAAVDAYYLAREYNAGVGSRLTGNSPRVAAILNLLTKGFGYFYLGSRGKGIAIFAGLTVLQLILNAVHLRYLSILALAVQIMLAADGYRVGRERLLADNPELCDDAVGRANPGWFTPRVLAVFVFVLTAMMVTVGSLGVAVARGGQLIPPGDGRFESTADGLRFTESKLHVSFTAPAEWQPFASRQSIAAIQGDGCSFMLMAHKRSWYEDKFPEQIFSGVKQTHPDASMSPDSPPSGMPDAKALVWTFLKDGKLMEQRLVHVVPDDIAYSLIESRMRDNEACRTDFAGIEKSLVLR